MSRALGVGIATIDSGVSPWHEDLDGRVAHFADFVNAQRFAYDDYGHGTHVAGIIAGSGRASAGDEKNASGTQRGVAPGAHLVVLKALDVSGNGFTSNVIAAIDYAIANRATYNIRVLNLSVAAGVYESFTKDPLTLAAKRAVDSGIVVVAAAGNRGRDGAGQPQYGGIASPGNAPWVLTVGASSDLGTVDRHDDVVAAFSSRGPAPIDENAKPDLVAPGVNIESTADPSSVLYAANPASRLWGSAKTGSEPYLGLTGTSMAAPVVTGAIALMLEANAALSPNAVKGDPRVHRGSARRPQPPDPGRRVPQCARRGGTRARVRGRDARARALWRSGALEPPDHLGQSPRIRRHARRPRQRVETGRDLG